MLPSKQTLEKLYREIPDGLEKIFDDGIASPVYGNNFSHHKKNDPTAKFYECAQKYFNYLVAYLWKHLSEATVTTKALQLMDKYHEQNGNFLEIARQYQECGAPELRELFPFLVKIHAAEQIVDAHNTNTLLTLLKMTASSDISVDIFQHLLSIAKKTDDAELTCQILQLIPNYPEATEILLTFISKIDTPKLAAFIKELSTFRLLLKIAYDQENIFLLNTILELFFHNTTHRNLLINILAKHFDKLKPTIKEFILSSPMIQQLLIEIFFKSNSISEEHFHLANILPPTQETFAVFKKVLNKRKLPTNFFRAAKNSNLGNALFKLLIQQDTLTPIEQTIVKICLTRPDIISQETLEETKNNPHVLECLLEIHSESPFKIDPHLQIQKYYLKNPEALSQIHNPAFFQHLFASMDFSRSDKKNTYSPTFFKAFCSTAIRLAVENEHLEMPILEILEQYIHACKTLSSIIVVLTPTEFAQHKALTDRLLRKFQPEMRKCAHTVHSIEESIQQSIAIADIAVKIKILEKIGEQSVPQTLSDVPLPAIE
jgi:hypothetical protein